MFRFAENSQIPYNEMLFFDDEERNIWDINRLGKEFIAILIDFLIFKSAFNVSNERKTSYVISVICDCQGRV